MDRSITTAAELDQMTPEQRQANFEDSFVQDLTSLDPREVAEVRDRHTRQLRQLGHDIPAQ